MAWVKSHGNEGVGSGGKKVWMSNESRQHILEILEMIQPTYSHKIYKEL